MNQEAWGKPEARARIIEEVKAMNVRLGEAIEAVKTCRLELEAYTFDEEKHHRDLEAWYLIEHNARPVFPPMSEEEAQVRIRQEMKDFAEALASE